MEGAEAAGTCGAGRWGGGGDAVFCWGVGVEVGGAGGVFVLGASAVCEASPLTSGTLSSDEDSVDGLSTGGLGAVLVDCSDKLSVSKEGGEDIS
jgi:hypothetical protein